MRTNSKLFSPLYRHRKSVKTAPKQRLNKVKIGSLQRAIAANPPTKCQPSGDSFPKSQQNF